MNARLPPLWIRLSLSGHHSNVTQCDIDLMDLHRSDLERAAVHGVSGDLNPYAYVQGRVMRYTDPFGLDHFQLVLLRRMADHHPELVDDALRTLGASHSDLRDAHRRWQARLHSRTIDTSRPLWEWWVPLIVW